VADSSTLFEVMLYPDSFDITKLDDILQHSRIKDYAYIFHDKEDKKAHYHVDIRTKDSCKFEDVAKWFGVNVQAVGKAQSKGGEVVRWANMLAYLTHRNSPDKYQYDDETVKSNFDWKKASEQADNQKRLDAIILGIATGQIREYNYTNHITDREYIRYKKQIELAFNYRKDRIRGENRSMECVFITGDSGVGKTTYAKLICEEKNYSYFVSSGSNDMLDGYMGQDVIVLDDMRPSCMGLSDLLKMLDNNTASSVKSRYKNKVLECRMIIVTSILEIDTFFNNVFAEEKETIVQLKRRCRTYIKMYRENMEIYVYDDSIRDYDMPFTAKNPIAKKYSPKKLSRGEQIERAKKMLGGLEIEDNGSFHEINDQKTVKEVQSVFDVNNVK
jgi:hypothetical protein